MSSPAKAWAQDWGNAYTARNRVDWRTRLPFWRDVLEMTGARSVYEVGCNAGWNLTAIKHADPLVQCYGCEVNDYAAQQAERAGFRIGRGTALDCLANAFEEYDLVFTAGVLIHVPPAELKDTMQAIVTASADYVLAVEYDWPEEKEVEYRGQPSLLWKRPHGKLYASMGLTLVQEWGAGAGFDRCLASLLRRSA